MAFFLLYVEWVWFHIGLSIFFLFYFLLFLLASVAVEYLCHFVRSLRKMRYAAQKSSQDKSVERRKKKIMKIGVSCYTKPLYAQYNTHSKASSSRGEEENERVKRKEEKYRKHFTFNNRLLASYFSLAMAILVILYARILRSACLCISAFHASSKYSRQKFYFILFSLLSFLFWAFLRSKLI